MFHVKRGLLKTNIQRLKKDRIKAGLDIFPQDL